jgi:hypothetical protein
MRCFRLPLVFYFSLALAGLLCSGTNASASPYACAGESTTGTCLCNAVRMGGTWTFAGKSCKCEFSGWACGCICQYCNKIKMSNVASMTSTEVYCRRW